MKKTYLALAVASAAFIASPAIAQDYQMEAGVSYNYYSPDKTSDDYAIGADFRYYFETVSTENRPLSEAAFLGRNGSVNLSYNTQDKADVDTIVAGLDYWFGDFYVSADYINTDRDSKDKEDFDVRVGYMVNDNLRVHAGYTDLEGRKHSKGMAIVGAKYVANLKGNFVNLEAELQESVGKTNTLNGQNSERVMNVRGDYYFTNSFSLGAEAIKSNTNGETIQANLNAKYFVLPNLSGELVLSANEGMVRKDTGVGVRVAARF